MQIKYFEVEIYAPVESEAHNPCWVFPFHCEVAQKKIQSNLEYPNGTMYISYLKYFKSLI